MASSSGSRFARQFPRLENQQTYQPIYSGMDDFSAGMGTSHQYVLNGVRGGVSGTPAHATLPFASIGGGGMQGAYHSLVPLPTTADYAPVQRYAWTDWKRYEGNDTSRVFGDRMVVPPPPGNYQQFNMFPKGHGMGGSSFLVVDNNHQKNIIPM
jgi:hypothetical protein